MRCLEDRYSITRGSRSARRALPSTTSASSRAAASSGNAWGIQPVSTVTAPGFSFRARRRVWRTFWSLVAVTVQEFTTTTSASSPEAAS